MNATEMMEELARSFGTTASVRSVFGEPIRAEGKTIVPVAKIAYGFGAGGGHGPARHHSDAGEQSEGGGGGLRAYPAGVLEITESRTRFLPFPDLRWLVGAFAAGVVAGHLVQRRRKRKD